MLTNQIKAVKYIIATYIINYLNFILILIKFIFKQYLLSVFFIVIFVLYLKFLNLVMAQRRIAAATNLFVNNISYFKFFFAKLSFFCLYKKILHHTAIILMQQMIFILTAAAFWCVLAMFF